MTIPTHRADLVRQAEERFDQLEDAIDDLVAAAPASPATPPEPVTDTAASARRDRDAVDVLNHLHAWHMLLLGWLDADAAGRAPAYPAEGYTCATSTGSIATCATGTAATAIATSRERVRASHRSVLARIDALDDAAIFSDGRPWLGGATLAEPVHECLGGHYAGRSAPPPGLPAGD